MTRDRAQLITRILTASAIVCALSGILIIARVLGPAIAEEFRYRTAMPDATSVVVTSREATATGITTRNIRPVNETFGIVIPRIGANAPVIANVDATNPTEYQQALAHGIAHAKGSVFPGRIGTMFLFSHSSADFLTATRYNSVFYLLDKLETGDAVYAILNGKSYLYRVTEKHVVAPSDTMPMTRRADRPELTLMTCWPPGTSLKRLVVTAVMDR